MLRIDELYTTHVMTSVLFVRRVLWMQSKAEIGSTSGLFSHPGMIPAASQSSDFLDVIWLL